ncbi:hypothetical protein [Halosimplex amylolyticum]|uniref:hypothetical protein n=1 Tax=Halosimplex amylolyticum TaxID=3396616 RepID=UPI003F56E095
MVAQSDADDERERSIGYWITHPWMGVGAVVAGLAGSLDPLFQLITGLVPMVYPIVSTLSSVGGLVPAIPTGLVQDAFVIFGLAYVGLMAVRAAEWFHNEYLT